jgi:hypothetical protein
MFIPRFTERGDRILACRGIAPDTKAAVAAILTGDGPAPVMMALNACSGANAPVERQKTNDHKQPSRTNPDTDWRAVHGANLHWCHG